MKQHDENPAPGDEPEAGPSANEATNLNEQESPEAIQNRHSRGSPDFDDPDRPRWTRQTKPEREFDYHHEDGSYSHTVLKGRNADRQKAFLNGRRFAGGISDLQMARQDRQRFEFYDFPGIQHFEKGAGEGAELIYRLPELVADLAARPDDPVFITEGEKDTDTARGLGLIATTNANGALKWASDRNALFAGRDVVVLVDNDEKGRMRRDLLGRELSPVARSIKAVELPGLRQNQDVTDWLESGKTLDDLLKAVDGTPEGITPRLRPDEFSVNQNGVPFTSLRNARIAIGQLGVTLRFDEFANRYLIDRLEGFGPALDDAALVRMRILMEERWSLKFGKERWQEIATDEARKNTFHPVRDYLDGLKWDGTDRLGGWLIDYAGAEDNEYVRAVSSITLIAAVRRVRRPGCKFDEMLVLESPQGGDKSSALETLAVCEEWFTDDCPLNADSKVMIEQITGRWIVEMAELKGLRRGDIEHVKSMLSRRTDKARLAYGRLPVELPRQCVMMGTTNDGTYLRDMTGNRRFWPVKVQPFDLEALRRDRDQLWAEAAAREAEGASIRLPKHLWAVAGEHQAEREISDPIYDILAERLDGLEGKVRASDIWEAIGLGEMGRRTQDHNVRLSAAMQKLGWRRPKSKLRFDRHPQHAWVKGSKGEAVDAYPEVPRKVVLGQDESGHDRRVA